MRKHASLRSMMVAVTVIVTVLALLTAGALVALTNALHRATASSAAATHSVRLAQEAEIDLLLHERTGDEIVKRDLEEGLRRKLTEARKFVTGAEEERLLARAVTEVEAYVATTRAPGKALELAAREEAAYEALASLVTINVAQSHASQADAERWEDMGNVLGMSLAALVIVVSGTVILWLRRRAFQPVFELATVMERFGRGERDARAAERGARELREMSARFNEMAAAISAQREAQMAFLGGVAHDLRNPLSALRMSIALLQADESLPSETRVRKTVARFGRQLERMDRMLGDFLDLANIEAGRLDLRLEILDARKLVEEVVALFEDASSEHRLAVRLPDHAVFVRCDPLRLEQVLTNLLSNAIKYSPRGSEIAIELEGRHDQLVLSVADHGCGISQKDKGRIFEPFRRAGLSKESVPGVGLGLFVVRKIVEAHQGKIEVDSVLGAGSTFRVLLPRDELVVRAVTQPEDVSRVTH